MERTSGSVRLLIGISGKGNVRRIFHIEDADGVSFRNGLRILPFCERCTKNISGGHPVACVLSGGKGTCVPEKENSGFARGGMAVFCYAGMLGGMIPREKMRSLERTFSPLPAASCVVNGPGILSEDVMSIYQGKYGTSR